MTKAHFRRNQKVWVESLGAWVTIERVVPIWRGGLSEPARVTYDVGLGRMFHASELTPDPRDAPQAGQSSETWRVTRSPNRWRSAEDTARHPVPGTHPVVVTDPQDWGGWRVPRAEYDRDPTRIECQARIIAATPRLRALVQELIMLVAADGADLEALRSLARRAASIELDICEALGDVDGPPDAQAPTASPEAQPDIRSPLLSERLAALEREWSLRSAVAMTPLAPRVEPERRPEPPAARFLRGRPK